MKHMEDIYRSTKNEGQQARKPADQPKQDETETKTALYYPPISYEDEINSGWSEF